MCLHYSLFFHLINAEIFLLLAGSSFGEMEILCRKLITWQRYCFNLTREQNVKRGHFFLSFDEGVKICGFLSFKSLFGQMPSEQIFLLHSLLINKRLQHLMQLTNKTSSSELAFKTPFIFPDLLPPAHLEPILALRSGTSNKLLISHFLK